MGQLDAARMPRFAAATPRMLFGPDLRVGPEKMVKHVEQKQNVLLVSAVLRHADIVNNHIADSFEAVLLMHQVGGECCCGYLREMLMFGDGQDFLLGQATKRHTIFKGKHHPPPTPLPIAAHSNAAP